MWKEINLHGVMSVINGLAASDPKTFIAGNRKDGHSRQHSLTAAADRGAHVSRIAENACAY